MRSECVKSPPMSVSFFIFISTPLMGNGIVGDAVLRVYLNGGSWGNSNNVDKNI